MKRIVEVCFDFVARICHKWGFDRFILFRSVPVLVGMVGALLAPRTGSIDLGGPYGLCQRELEVRRRGLLGQSVI